MCTANVTSCPRNVASADTKQFGKAQSETCGQGDGCVLGADPLLRGYHWGMRLFVNHFPASQSRPAPAEVGLPCKDCLLSLPSMPSWSETLVRLTVALKVHLAMSGELLGFPQLGRGSATDLWWTKAMYCLPQPPRRESHKLPQYTQKAEERACTQEY